MRFSRFRRYDGGMNASLRVRIEGANCDQSATARHPDRVALNPRARFVVREQQIDSMNSPSGLLFIQFD